MKEESKLCGFRIQAKDLFEFNSNLKCLYFYDTSLSFDIVIQRSLNLIQESAVVERGYRLAATLPPIERLERKIKNRTCAVLRKCMILHCTSLSRVMNTEMRKNHVIVEILDDMTETETFDLPSITFLKKNLKILSETRIDFYIELMKLDENRAVEKLSFINDYIEISGKDIQKNLEAVTGLMGISDSKYEILPTASDSLTLTEYLIHELYCLTLNARQEQISSSCTNYLKQLHLKAIELVHDLEGSLDLFLPRVSEKEATNVQSDINQNHLGVYSSMSEIEIQPLEPMHEDASSKTDVFEGVAGLESIDLPTRSSLSRYERIALKKKKEKKSTFLSPLDFLDELKSVLNKNL